MSRFHSGPTRASIAALLALLLCSAASAQEPGRIAIETYRLANGLTVILAPDRTSQVVAVDVWYHVGSRDEVRGRTGFAHLFEHMMFQGSTHVRKGGHIQLVQRAGGMVNGTTSEDRTAYYQVLPSNQLRLGLWLEADRMRSLAITDSTFNNQREAVKEERRLRIDNQPYVGAMAEGAYALADSATCFPYAHSVIGSMADLNAATTADVQAFFDRYYKPGNATLTLVGDFAPAEAKTVIQEYFGDIPASAPAEPAQCQPAYSTGQIRRRWPDAKATLPGVLVAFRLPEYRSEDMPALDLLAMILGQGESSRLNRAVVRERKLAVATNSMANPSGPRRGPGVMLALGVANQGVSVDSLETGIMAEYRRLVTEGVTPEELERAKNGYRTQLITQRQQALFRAEAIQQASLYLGNPEAVNSIWQRYAAVTVDDVKRVADKYLRPDNSLVLLITPEASR